MGVRVMDEHGQTVRAAGRLFDNMSLSGAEQIIASLENLDRQRQEQRLGAERRNDLYAILEDNRRSA
jgi:hypothetical protein